MAKYHPYVQAVLWTGTNVIEIRQFINSFKNLFTNAVIRNGILFLEGILEDGTPMSMSVDAGNWLVISGPHSFAVQFTPAEFAAQYELAP